MSRCFVLMVLMLMGVKSFAQQDADYTQYMYNMSVINPGYALTDTDLIQAGLLYRAQWVGAEGGPNTATLFGHMSFTERMQGGISVVRDEIGDIVSETNFFLDYAYVLPIGKTSAISLGIKAGFTAFSTDFSGFVYSDPRPDPTFASSVNTIFPNFGLGAFYFGETHYIGFSVPNILQSEHLRDDEGIYTSASEELHLYLTGGYVFHLAPKFKLKPAFMANQAVNAPFSLDLTANVLYDNTIEVGVAYGIQQEGQALANFKVTENLRIGYAYSYLFSNLGRFNNGSHEVMVLFDLNTRENGYDKSPRFF